MVSLSKMGISAMRANVIEFPFQQIAATSFKKALASFENRLGVSYTDLATSEEAQKIARKHLDKETMRLRTKYMDDTRD